MLDKIARYYEEQVEDTVDDLAALMTQLVITFLSVVVGGLIIAM